MTLNSKVTSHYFSLKAIKREHGVRFVFLKDPCGFRVEEEWEGRGVRQESREECLPLSGAPAPSSGAHGPLPSVSACTSCSVCRGLLLTG